MINIRYHIVSITAVFLALGIGVALGSTFLDRATVSVLDNNITSAENRIEETNAENDRLNEQITSSKERDTALTVSGSDSLFAEELTDLPVLVVAAPGVSEDAIDLMGTMVTRSSAEYRGALRLSDKLAITDEVDDDLATDLGLTDPTAAELRTAATSSISGALLAAGLPLDDRGLSVVPGEETPTTTTTAPGTTTTTTERDVPPCCTATPPTGDTPVSIAVLAERGYLDIDPGPAFDEGDPILEAVGYRYVYLGAPDLDAEQNSVLLAVLPSSGAAMAATVVTASQDAPEDEELVPTVVASVRANPELEQRYNTVDNTETFAGLVATIFALRDMGTVEPGQYGQAAGASAILPPSP